MEIDLVAMVGAAGDGGGRRGLAGEASVAMAQFAFDRLGADTLYAVSHPDNGASLAVMVKLGMRYRGLEDWYARPVATYEVTAEAWRAARWTGI